MGESLQGADLGELTVPIDPIWHHTLRVPHMATGQPTILEVTRGTSALLGGTATAILYLPLLMMA
jgi:hypothetical protein